MSSSQNNCIMSRILLCHDVHRLLICLLYMFVKFAGGSLFSFQCSIQFLWSSEATPNSSNGTNEAKQDIKRFSNRFIMIPQTFVTLKTICRDTTSTGTSWIRQCEHASCTATVRGWESHRRCLRNKRGDTRSS